MRKRLQEVRQGRERQRREGPEVVAKIIHHAGLGFAIIPKSGGSSIKTAIRSGMGLSDDVGVHADKRLNYTGDTEGLFIVAFIRNPFERLVSAWANKIHSKRYMARRLERHGFNLGMPFDAFVRHLEGHCFDAHFQRQSNFLPDRVDIFSRLEDAPDVWPKIQARFPWLPDMPHKNTTDHKPADEMFTPETLAIAERLYRDDIELWHSLSA